VAAEPDVVWRWVCQLTQAPYSYDLIDNLGRRSPRTLTPGAERMAAGDRFTSIFRVTRVEGHHVRAERGRWVVTYDVVPAVGGSRLIGRFDCRPAGIGAAALAWGDLPMMRKQLLTLKRLAETR
jgi:hypothetical protein